MLYLHNYQVLRPILPPLIRYSLLRCQLGFRYNQIDLGLFIVIDYSQVNYDSEGFLGGITEGM